MTRPLTDSVAHIDITGPSVIGSFAVGNRPDDIWFNASGSTAFVTNLNDHTVGVINTSTNTQTATYPVAGEPLRLLLGPGETKLYVTLNGGAVAVLNASTGALDTTLSVPGAPNGIVMNSQGTRVYVSATSGSVTEIATTSDSITHSFLEGGTPQDIVVSANGNTLYTANESGWVDIRNVQTGTRTDSIPVPGAFGLALTTDETQLWVTQSSAGSVTVIDLAHRTLTPVPTLGTPRHISFTPDGRAALVANEAGFAQVIR